MRGLEEQLTAERQRREDAEMELARQKQVGGLMVGRLMGGLTHYNLNMINYC